jgi:hypothetical protein
MVIAIQTFVNRFSESSKRKAESILEKGLRKKTKISNSEDQIEQGIKKHLL